MQCSIRNMAAGSDRVDVMFSYLGLCIVPLEALVDQAFVEDLDEGVVLDMTRKGHVTVRLLDAPFFLQLGCCFSVVCTLASMG